MARGAVTAFLGCTFRGRVRQWNTGLQPGGGTAPALPAATTNKACIERH